MNESLSMERIITTWNDSNLLDKEFIRGFQKDKDFLRKWKERTSATQRFLRFISGNWCRTRWYSNIHKGSTCPKQKKNIKTNIRISKNRTSYVNDFPRSFCYSISNFDWHFVRVPKARVSFILCPGGFTNKLLAVDIFQKFYRFLSFLQPNTHGCFSHIIGVANPTKHICASPVKLKKIPAIRV